MLTAIFSIIGTLQLFSEPQVLRSITGDISSSYTPNLPAYTQAFTSNNPTRGGDLRGARARHLLLSFGFLRLVQRRGAVA